MSEQLCKTCGFMNDETRIFCSNCGARLREKPASDEEPKTDLDEKGAAKVKENKGKAPTSERREGAIVAAGRRPGPRAKRRIPGYKPDTNPTPSFGVSIFKEMVLIAALALLLATLVQILRPPDDLLPQLPVQKQMAKELANEVHQASQSRYPRILEVSTEQANNFLASRLQSSENSGAFSARFVRSYIIPGDDSFRFGVEQNLFGYPFYLELHGKPAKEGDQLGTELTAGSIGRLPIPSQVIEFFAGSFSTVLDILNEQLGGLKSADSVVITPEGAEIKWSGKNAQ